MLIIKHPLFMWLGMYSLFSFFDSDQRIEVHGSNGMLQAENKHPTTVVLWNKEGTHKDTIS
jgi:hypothetical protein